MYEKSASHLGSTNHPSAPFGISWRIDKSTQGAYWKIEFLDWGVWSSGEEITWIPIQTSWAGESRCDWPCREWRLMTCGPASSCNTLSAASSGCPGHVSWGRRCWRSTVLEGRYPCLRGTRPEREGSRKLKGILKPNLYPSRWIVCNSLWTWNRIIKKKNEFIVYTISKHYIFFFSVLEMQQNQQKWDWLITLRRWIHDEW